MTKKQHPTHLFPENTKSKKGKKQSQSAISKIAKKQHDMQPPGNGVPVTHCKNCGVVERRDKSHESKPCVEAGNSVGVIGESLGA